MSLTRRGVRCWVGLLFFAVVSGEVVAKGPDDYEALLQRKSEGMVEEKAWSEGAHQLHRCLIQRT